VNEGKVGQVMFLQELLIFCVWKSLAYGESVPQFSGILSPCSRCCLSSPIACHVFFRFLDFVQLPVIVLLGSKYTSIHILTCFLLENCTCQNPQVCTNKWIDHPGKGNYWVDAVTRQATQTVQWAVTYVICWSPQFYLLISFFISLQIWLIYHITILFSNNVRCCRSSHS
jgi:hypothetical protein